MTDPKPVAMVTGGARRVGRAIVLELAAAGFDVALTYHRSQDAAMQTAEQARAAGARCETFCADLTDAQAAADLADAHRRAFGRLDVLVNNASLYLPGSLEQLDLAAAQAMWAVHVQSPLILCRKLSDLLRGAGGHVINMLDLLAERPWPQYLAYCASKAALANLTLSLARTLAPRVTVNGIAPGVVEWPDDFPLAQREQYLERVPLGRAGTPRDVADAVVFLATKADYMTGQIIRLDGGRSIA